MCSSIFSSLVGSAQKELTALTLLVTVEGLSVLCPPDSVFQCGLAIPSQAQQWALNDASAMLLLRSCFPHN